MYITSIEHFSGKRKRKYKVRLDTGTDFQLYEKELNRYNLTENEELPVALYEELLRDVFCPRAKKRALHLLEKQDRTVSDLRRKLKQSGYPPEAIEEALAYVASYHYTDDLRYATSFVRFHQETKSKRRIRQDLMTKGIDKDTIEKAMEDYTACEADQIRNLLRKKSYNPTEADRAKKDKLFRFLLGRGYDMEDITQALQEY